MLSKNKLLVYPTSRAIRDYLNLNSDSNMLLPNLLTIDEFLKKSITLDDYKYCDEEQRTLLLKEACLNVDTNKLGISKEFNKFLKESEYIYRFLNELSSEKIDINKIKEFDIYDFYLEHLSILEDVYKNYISILEEKKYVDKINLKDKYKINTNFLEKFEEIIINFEGYFTNLEFEIIENISKVIPLKIKFTKNEYNEKSIKTIVKDRSLLKNDFTYLYDLTNHKIIEEKQINVKYDLDLIGFSQRINQIAYIKNSVVNAINSGIDPSKIAVVVPDEKFATQLQLFDTENYFNYSMGKSIENEKLFQVAIGIYFYIIEDEIKYIENLNFLELDKNFIDNNIKVLFTKCATKDSFTFIIEYLKTFIDSDELKVKFEELIYRFNYLIFSIENSLKVKDVYKIFLQKLSKLTLDDVNSGKITVMGLLETRSIGFDAVIIPDFNEDFIPKKSVKDKFLSTAIKETVGLPTSKDRENLQKYYYKALIEKSKKVYISFVNSDSSTISRFASQLFKNTKLDIEKTNDNSYKHILYKNNTIKHSNENISLQIDLSKITWSASAIKTYLECKRKYYLKSIIGIKEHEISLKPKSYELGQIIHSILEKYIQSSDRSFENLMNIFNEYKTSNPFLLFDLTVWKEKLKNYYEYENEYLSNNRTLSCEEEVQSSFNGIKIKGTIDRLDLKDSSIYEIIDYKTSSSLKVDTPRTYEKSKDFQLEFYYIAVNQKYNTTNIKPYYFDLANTKLLEEITIEKKLEVLSGIFDEFKDSSKDGTIKEVSFDKCEEKATCQYCSYKTICNRD